MNSSPLPKLYVSRTCPYAHRVLIVAALKKYSFEMIELSDDNIPDWYKNDVNPRGEVPALQLPNGVCLSESALIAQYIDDATEPKSSLFSPSAEVRQKIREFNRNIEEIQWACYGALMASPDTFEAKKDNMLAKLQEASTLLSTTSDFAVGSSFSIADVNFAPFAIRFSYTLKAYCGVDIREVAPRLGAFVDQCLMMPAIASTTPAPEFFISSYKGYAGSKKNEWKYILTRGVNCPFSERVTLTWEAATKGSTAPAYLKEEQYLTTEIVEDLSTVANVPTLKLPSGRVVDNSIEAVTFLAERFTEAALVPSAAEDVFAGRWLVDTCGRVTDDIFGNILSKSKGFEVEAAVKGELLRADTLYGASPKGGPYLFGSHPTIYDFIVLPIFHRVDLLLGSDAFAALAPNIAAAVVAIRNDAVLSPCLVTADKFFSA